MKLWRHGIAEKKSEGGEEHFHRRVQAARFCDSQLTQAAVDLKATSLGNSAANPGPVHSLDPGWGALEINLRIIA